MATTQSSTSSSIDRIVHYNSQVVPLVVPPAPATAIENNVVTIYPWEIPLRALKEEHVRYILQPEEHLEADKQLWEAKIEARSRKIKDLKSVVRRLARQRIQQKLTEQAVSHSLQLPTGQPVQSFRNIKRWWKRLVAPSDDDTNILYDILYGWCDLQDDWDIVLEDEILSANNIRYDRLDNRPIPKSAGFGNIKIDAFHAKGCIARQINAVKCNLVKQVNDASISTHGVAIFISRRDDEVTKETRCLKKKKGTYFVTTHQSKKQKKTDSPSESNSSTSTSTPPASPSVLMDTTRQARTTSTPGGVVPPLPSSVAQALQTILTTFFPDTPTNASTTMPRTQHPLASIPISNNNSSGPEDIANALCLLQQQDNHCDESHDSSDDGDDDK